MKKAIAATKKEFQSSSGKTPEYLAWHRLFKREITTFLTRKLNATEVNISKPNHVDLSGFFKVGDQCWYIQLGDIRGFKDTLLVRTAKDQRDCTGGQNQYATLHDDQAFMDEFENIVLRNRA